VLLIFNKRTCYISEKENGLSLTTDTVKRTISKCSFDKEDSLNVCKKI
jgi:hypothetical protein